MSKKRNKRQQPPRTQSHTAAPAQSMEAFTFGEPTPVLDRRDILDYVECIDNGQWYEPPVSFRASEEHARRRAPQLTDLREA